MQFELNQTYTDLTSHDYANMACWCNSNDATIQNNGDGSYTLIPIPDITEEEIAIQKIAELKSFLNNTDYVVSKLSEYLLLGKDVSEIKEEYQEIFKKRENAREEINNLYSLYPSLQN